MEECWATQTELEKCMETRQLLCASKIKGHLCDPVSCCWPRAVLELDSDCQIVSADKPKSLTTLLTSHQCKCHVISDTQSWSIIINVQLLRLTQAAKSGHGRNNNNSRGHIQYVAQSAYGGLQRFKSGWCWKDSPNSESWWLHTHVQQSGTDDPDNQHSLPFTSWIIVWIMSRKHDDVTLWPLKHKTLLQFILGDICV